MATIVTTFTTINGMLIHEDRGGIETEYVSDPLGSLVQCRNSSGTKTYEAEYWPYGELQTSTGTNPSYWGYVGLLGYLIDSATMLYVRARYLMAKFARWLTVDPLWPGERPFGYCESDPVFYSDESGLKKCSIQKSNPCSELRGGPGSCIAALCSFKSVDDMIKYIKSFLGVNERDIIGIINLIKKSWGKNFAPFDCCKKASSGTAKFGSLEWAFGMLCKSRWLWGRDPLWSSCVKEHGRDDPLLGDFSPCSDCCSTRFAENSTDLEMCRKACGVG